MTVVLKSWSVLQEGRVLFRVDDPNRPGPVPFPDTTEIVAACGGEPVTVELDYGETIIKFDGVVTHSGDSITWSRRSP